MDFEFWDSHCDFYGSSFREYPVECRRVHFFSGDEQNGEALIKLLLSGALRTEIEKELSVFWQGYCVLRPTPSFVIGRTALTFCLPTETEGKPFLKVSNRCQVNLLNTRFEIDTPEFIQQDPNLGRCATASLWVTTQLMAEKFGTHRFRYGTITRHAMGTVTYPRNINVAFDPADGDSGLELSEMKNALAATGLNSLEFTVSTRDFGEEEFCRICHEIYSFVESGFPVILCIEESSTNSNHAVTAVGHLLPHSKNLTWIPASKLLLPDERDKYGDDAHFLVSTMATSYYVHDDERGPFTKIEIKEWCEPQSNGEDAIVEAKVGVVGEKHYLRHALVPVPPIIRCSALEPFRIVYIFFKGRYPQVTEKDFAFVWRLVLVEGSDFKRSICARKYSNKLKTWYATLHLPKYIWLVELSVSQANKVATCFPKGGKRRIAGEYLLDATCPSRDTFILAERMVHQCWDYRCEPEDYMTVEEDLPHSYRCYTPTILGTKK